MSEREGSDVTAEVASILADLSDVWAAQAQRWYDRAKSPDADFVPEDAVSETIDLVEHLAPLVERSVALTKYSPGGRPKIRTSPKSSVPEYPMLPTVISVRCAPP